MGFKDALERSRQTTYYGSHRITTKNELKWLPEGGFIPRTFKLAGAHAEYEPGADISGRTTLTRVAAGAIIAGPVGAVVGGLFKKDRARGYVSITFPDGNMIVIDGPVKDEKKLRGFAATINLRANL
jgi:hypothetical protein